jgi:Domain of unknown function (DUF4384)
MKHTCRCALLIVSLMSLAQGSLVLCAQREAGAKQLFYDPASGAMIKSNEKQMDRRTGKLKVKPVVPEKAKYVGLNYWIDLNEVGAVTSDHVFHTGDRIKLRIRSNVDGYLSLWSLDSKGRGTLLFPKPGEGSNKVQADTEYVTPGEIRFAPPVEDERLLVFFSRSTSDVPSPTGSQADSTAVAKVLGSTGSKSLVFESEKKVTAEAGDYVVNKSGGPIAKEIRLKHEAGAR